jgi:predicted DsbA family dithiol-disulfide isomerase
MTGLPYEMPALGAPYPSSSMPALIASKWMLLNHPEHFENFDLEMFQAFFEFGLDISKYPILKQLANSFGVDEDEFEAGIKDPKYEKLVLEDHANAKKEGVDSIPGVIIGDNAISGAVPIDEYRQAIKKALA